MKKLLTGLFIFGVLTVAVQAHAFTLDDLMLQIQNLRSEVASLRTILKASALNPLITTTPTTDLTPRISYYSGKVNQHVDIASSTWQSDADGSSGAGIDKLTYCKKWYPNTTSVTDYKIETINSWHDGGNLNNYTSTRMSYKCVINIITPPIITPINGGWSAWSNSGSCINNLQTQTRTCTNPVPVNGGLACSGSIGQQVSCSVIPTPTPTPTPTPITTYVNIYTSIGPNGTISPAGPVSIASGVGLNQKFTITPNAGYTPIVTGCGGSLSGNVYTTASIVNQCTITATFKPIPLIISPVNGNWSAWSNSGGCINNLQTQTRACTNPAPANGGAPCSGLSTQQISCININNTSSCLPTGVCFDDRVLLITEGKDGNFIDSNNVAIEREIIKYYSNNTGKEADFLASFQDWDTTPGVSLSTAYSVPINSKNSGMGMIERIDEEYGSKGNIKSFLKMPNIKVLSLGVAYSNKYIFGFAHEIGHHWLAYFYDPLLLISPAWVHYSPCVIFNDGDFSDLMLNGFFNFQKTDDANIFNVTPIQTNPYIQKYSDLSLYVMGLIPASEVGSFQMISDDKGNCPLDKGMFPSEGFSISATSKQVSLQDLIKVYGERKPIFPNTQKDFTVQVALVVHKNSDLTQIDADNFKKYLDEVEKYLPFAFSNKATFHFIRNINETTTNISNVSNSNVINTPDINTIAPTSINRTLKVGIKGDDVVTLQTFLGLTADGSFGPITKAKVMEWQTQNGLKVDGLFGIQSAQKAGLSN